MQLYMDSVLLHEIRAYVRRTVPGLKSSHVASALAAALGYNSPDALAKSTDESRALSLDSFRACLREHGYGVLSDTAAQALSRAYELAASDNLDVNPERDLISLLSQAADAGVQGALHVNADIEGNSVAVRLGPTRTPLSVKRVLSMGQMLADEAARVGANATNPDFELNFVLPRHWTPSSVRRIIGVTIHNGKRCKLTFFLRRAPQLPQGGI